MDRAYVPGHPHDLFLSYAHDEAEWVRVFRERLDKAIRTRLGRRALWWQDTSDLRVGQVWRQEIESAVQEAVAFLAICSPTYIHPDRRFCHRECEMFRDHHQAAGDPAFLKDRLLKVIKTPSLDGAHLTFFDELQHVEFFGKTGDEFSTSSVEFESQVSQVAKWIAEILVKERNRRTPIYLAQCAADLEGDRASLDTQLEKWGYNVTSVPSTFGGNRMRDHVDKAEWCIFLLAGSYDSYVERQLRMAVDLGKQIACWIHPVDSRAAGRQQQELIKLAHQIQARHELLGNPSIRGVIDELQKLLAPAKEREALAGSAARNGNVFLLYDGAEAAEAGKIREVIRDEEMAVFTPPPDPSTHRQLMTECDGVLLYRGASPKPDNWLLQSFPHVYCADQLYPERRRPLKARTFFVADPSPLALYPGADIIPYRGEISAAALKPFLDRMQGEQARSADAGR